METDPNWKDCEDLSGVERSQCQEGARVISGKQTKRSKIIGKLPQSELTGKFFIVERELAETYSYERILKFLESSL